MIPLPMIDISKNPTPSQEMMLFDLVQRLDRLRVGRLAVHIHFSKLSNAYRRESYLNIATEAFSQLASGFEGQLFNLYNRDLFFIAKGAVSTTVEAAVDRIKGLFSQDPLTETYSYKGASAFYSLYNIETEYDDLMHEVRELLRASDAHRIKQQQQEAPKSGQAGVAAPSVLPQPVRTPLRPEGLERLERLLDTVDVSNISRRQSVCTIIDNAAPQPLFEEIFISIEDLQNVVTPGVDLLSNAWLFRYLTQTLDRRVMFMLMRDGVATARPFSLNLNVATILSPEFAKFEAIITPQLKGRLVIEMNALDVFSDMGAFLFARDYLHDHGFRLCLDGLTHHTLVYTNRAKMGFDLMKLYWTPNGLDDMLPSMKPDVRNIIMDTGQAHTILCRCDDERAIQTGQEIGIVMFQGRQVDRALTAARPPLPTRF